MLSADKFAVAAAWLTLWSNGGMLPRMSRFQSALRRHKYPCGCPARLGR